MTGTDLILPLPETGELIPLDRLVGALANGSQLALNGTAAQQADMLDALRRLDSEVATLKRLLAGQLVEESKVRGTKTLDLGDGRKAVLSKGERTIVDPEKLAAGLRRAGMPDALVDEIVVTTVSQKVDLRRAQQAAHANPKYARALSRCSTTVEEPVTVTIKRG